MLTLPLQPAVEVLLLFTGTLLILLELHRPGWILPGCLGVLVLLVSFASLVRTGSAVFPISMYLTYVLFAACSTRSANAFFAQGFAMSLLVCFGSIALFASSPVQGFALVSSAGLAFLTGHLTSLARIARTNKFPLATSKQASPAQNPLD